MLRVFGRRPTRLAEVGVLVPLHLRGGARRGEGDKDTSAWRHIGAGRADESTAESHARSQRAASDRLRQLFRDDAVQNDCLNAPGSYLAATTPNTDVTTRTVVLPAALDGTEAASSTNRSVEVLEQELLDDDAGYFPAVLEADDAMMAPRTTSIPHDTVRDEVRYVPGQQLVSPGFTRYRVDVQYQGCDFDGWCKSTARRLLRRDAAGGVTVVRTADESGTPTTRPQAKTVLEEALAVALDVVAVAVVAAVTPETGVSVRRLSCHVDVPSEVEMQPRTVLQRATMWLHQRGCPLAILGFTPCRNQDFHARHSGVRRVYCYRILNRVAPPLFDAGLQWHVDRQLDVARMRRFAKAMEGTRDFGYFADPKMANALRRAAVTVTGRTTAAYAAEHVRATSAALTETLAARHPGDGTAAPKVTIERGLTNLERAAAMPTFNEYGQRVISYDAKAAQYYKPHTNLPTVRTVDTIEVVRQEDEVLIWVVGQSFLRHQIRNMVSVLKASGHGLWDELELQHAFATGFTASRKQFARERLPAAPAHGLTLWDVEYPAQHRDDHVAFVDSGPFEEIDLVHSA